MAKADQLDTMRTDAFSALAGAMDALLFDSLNAADAQQFTLTALEKIGAMLAWMPGATIGGAHHG